MQAQWQAGMEKGPCPVCLSLGEEYLFTEQREVEVPPPPFFACSACALLVQHGRAEGKAGLREVPAREGEGKVPSACSQCAGWERQAGFLPRAEEGQSSAGLFIAVRQYPPRQGEGAPLACPRHESSPRSSCPSLGGHRGVMGSLLCLMQCWAFLPAHQRRPTLKAIVWAAMLQLV